MLDQPDMRPTAAMDEAPVLPPAVVSYVESHTRTYPGGQKYAVTECGFALFHSSQPGCPNWTPEDLTAWTRRYRPELWTQETDV